MKEMEAIWLAGVLDCDGHIGMFRRSSNGVKNAVSPHYHRPVVQISQTKRELIDRVCEIVGSGKVYGKKEEGKSNLYHYRMREKGLVRVLEAIIPYLILKKRQAQLLLKFCNRKTYNGRRIADEEYARREAIHTELAILNRKGPGDKPREESDNSHLKVVANVT